MKSAIVAVALAVLLCPFSGCDSTDSTPSADAAGTNDTAGVAKDVPAEDTAKHDTADVTPLPTTDSPTAPDGGIDVSLPGGQDAAVGETARTPDVTLDVASDGPTNPVIDGAPKPGIDAGKPVGMDGPPDMGTTIADGGQARVTLRSGGAYGNCMPIVSTDPIVATWTVDIAGARGTSAQLTKATVTVTGSSTIVQDFTVDNPTIALTNGAGSADQRKPINQRQPNTACDSMCSGGVTYRLDLAYAIDGQTIAVSKSGSFSCAY